MDLLKTIFSNNRMALDAVEQAEPVLRRLAGKMTERLRSGGKIVCLDRDNPEPEDKIAVSDVLIAVEEVPSPRLAEQLRTWRRRGVLTACITGDAASAAASAADIAVCLPVEAVDEPREAKLRLAQQMALDALLTLAAAGSGVQTGATQTKGDDALEKAAAALMKELPALDRESAVELIQRHGSVRKAAKAYKANVQAEL